MHDLNNPESPRQSSLDPDFLEKELTFHGSPYTIFYSERYAQHPSWYSFADESEVRDLYWNIDPGDTVLDVGAAFGSYTLTALACGAASVWAWSPQHWPEEKYAEIEFFKKSLLLNGWSDRCFLFRSGVYDRIGFVDTITASFLKEDDGKWTTIPVEPLDVWAERELVGVPAISWMKLDVEGAEVEVLSGGQSLIQRYRPKILVENHLFKRDSIASEVTEVLTSFGYEHISNRPHHSVSHSLYLPR